MSMDANAGPAVSAMSDGAIFNKRSGKKDRPTTSNTPTRIDATSAPRIEPMPPITMTTNARISISSPMPDSTERIGPAIRPARPARKAPMPKMIVYKRRMLTPNARIIGPLLAPARISIPVLVLEINIYRIAATSKPTAIITNL